MRGPPLRTQPGPPLFPWRQHRRKLCQSTNDSDNQAEEDKLFHLDLVGIDDVDQVEDLPTHFSVASRKRA